MTKTYVAKTITAAGTTVLFPASAYVTSLLIVCSGGGLTITLENPAHTQVLVPAIGFAPTTDGNPNVFFQYQNDQAFMNGGVVAVATGTGHVDMWIAGYQSEKDPAT